MYAVEKSQLAQKFLDKHISDRINNGLRKLEIEPVPSDSKFISRDQNNDKIFRWRIGDYRTMYKVKESAKTVLVAKIDKRPRIYNR